VLERESWYEQYFYRFAHRNFIGVETPLGTVVVSAKKEDTKSSPGILLIYSSFLFIYLFFLLQKREFILSSGAIDTRWGSKSFDSFQYR